MQTEPIKVLVVEDHQVTLDGLQMGLSRERDMIVVGTASDSDIGFTMAEAQRPDVILLDLHLPGSNGPKSMIQAFCSVPGSQVIVFSGESRMAFIQIVLNLGVSGYLLKSESVNKVADSIRAVMCGKKPLLSEDLVAKDTKVTKSEHEVLRMLALGMKYQDIADERFTSPATVRKQCELLQLKLGLNSREELIAWAVRSGYGGLD